MANNICSCTMRKPIIRLSILLALGCRRHRTLPSYALNCFTSDAATVQYRLACRLPGSRRHFSDEFSSQETKGPSTQCAEPTDYLRTIEHLENISAFTLRAASCTCVPRRSNLSRTAPTELRTFSATVARSRTQPRVVEPI